MAKKEILKQIYTQALLNRQQAIADTPPSPTQHAKVALAVTQPEMPCPPEPAGRVIDATDIHPQNLNEREQLMHDLMGVYRQKRQMIDDLPPKHRVLLEKLSRLMLGVQNTKQPPGGH